MLPVLVMEQRVLARLEALERQVEELEARNSQLEARNARLEAAAEAAGGALTEAEEGVF